MAATMDKDFYIRKDGVEIGRWTPGSDIYISLFTGEIWPNGAKATVAVARFKKYLHTASANKKRAREWVQVVCGQLDTPTIIARLKETHPVGLLQSLNNGD